MNKAKAEQQKASIAERLAAAVALLDELESAAPRIAHDAALGDPDAAAGFRENQSKIADTKIQIDMLKLAIDHDEQMTKRRDAARQAAERRGLIDRSLKKADTLFKTELPELQRCIAATIEQWKKVNAAVDAVHAAVPLHHPIKAGLLISAGELRNVVSEEIARLDNIELFSSNDMARSFPRGSVSNRQYLQQPAKIPPMLERIDVAVTLLRTELETRPVFPVNTDRQVPPPSAAPVADTPTKRDAADIQKELQAEADKEGRALDAEPPATPHPYESPHRERTAAEIHLAGLLKKQTELAKDTSPAGEAAYQANLAEITAAMGQPAHD